MHPPIYRKKKNRIEGPLNFYKRRLYDQGFGNGGLY